MDSSDSIQNNGLNKTQPVAPNATQPNPSPASIFAQAPIQAQAPTPQTAPIQPLAPTPTTIPQPNKSFNPKKLVIIIVILIALCLGGGLAIVLLNGNGTNKEAPTKREENAYVSGAVVYNTNIKIDDLLKVSYPNGFKNVSEHDYLAEYSRKDETDFFVACKSDIFVVDGFYDAKKYAENVAKDYEDNILDELSEIELNGLTWYGFANGDKETPSYHYFTAFGERVYRFDFEIASDSDQCKKDFKKILYSIQKK